MSEPVRNWEQWERGARIRFYRRKLEEWYGDTTGPLVPEDVLAGWVRECDE